MEVTAIDSDCDARPVSSPQLIGLHLSMDFEFVISIQDSAPCTVWVADNAARKLSDVQSIITSELQKCGVSTSCMVNGQFVCESSQDTIAYE